MQLQYLWKQSHCSTVHYNKTEINKKLFLIGINSLKILKGILPLYILVENI